MAVGGKGHGAVKDGHLGWTWRSESRNAAGGCKWKGCMRWVGSAHGHPRLCPGSSRLYRLGAREEGWPETGGDVGAFVLCSSSARAPASSLPLWQPEGSSASAPGRQPLSYPRTGRVRSSLRPFPLLVPLPQMPLPRIPLTFSRSLVKCHLNRPLKSQQPLLSTLASLTSFSAPLLWSTFPHLTFLVSFIICLHPLARTHPQAGEFVLIRHTVGAK